MSTTALLTTVISYYLWTGKHKKRVRKCQWHTLTLRDARSISTRLLAGESFAIFVKTVINQRNNGVFLVSFRRTAFVSSSCGLILNPAAVVSYPRCVFPPLSSPRQRLRRCYMPTTEPVQPTACRSPACPASTLPLPVCVYVSLPVFSTLSPSHWLHISLRCSLFPLRPKQGPPQTFLGAWTGGGCPPQTHPESRRCGGVDRFFWSGRSLLKTAWSKKMEAVINGIMMIIIIKAIINWVAFVPKISSHLHCSCPLNRWQNI